MADKKISQLTTLAQADVAVTADFLPIVDTSATETKKATPQALVQAGATGATLAVALGAVTTPSYSFTGDLNSGLWSPAADTIAASTGGSERLRVDSSGNLGIGTSSPGTRLQVSATSPTRGISAIFTGTGATGTQIQLTQGGVDDWAFGQPANVSAFAIWSGRATGSDGNERMRLDSSGNLGIGTSSPGVRLDVQSAFATEGSIRLTSPIDGSVATPRASSFSFRSGSTPSETARIASFNRFGNVNGGDLVFSTADTSNVLQTRATIDSSGNIVAGASAALATNATNGFLYVPTCAGTPTGTPTAITGMAPIVVNTTNNKLYFYSGGAWRDAGP